MLLNYIIASREAQKYKKMSKKIRLTIFGIIALFGLFGSLHIYTAYAGREPDVFCDRAVIYGTIEPNGTPMNAWFEWGTNRSNVQNGGGKKVGSYTISPNVREETVSYELPNLAENATYVYRLVVQFDGDDWPGTTESFTTPSCNRPTPDPTVNLDANPTRVPYDGSSTVTWQSQNAESCVANGGSRDWAGNKSTYGSFYAQHLTNNTTFSITCSNNSGKSATDTVTVNVDSLVLIPETANRKQRRLFRSKLV